MSSHEQAEVSPTDAAAEIYTKINQKDLEAARTLAASPERRFSAISRSQAEDMAEEANIKLGPDEIALYCILREQMPPEVSEGADVSEKVKDEGEGIRPWQLSDQKILAAVLESMGDQDRVQKFKSFFPNIFEKRINPTSR